LDEGGSHRIEFFSPNLLFLCRFPALGRPFSISCDDPNASNGYVQDGRHQFLRSSFFASSCRPAKPPAKRLDLSIGQLLGKGKGGIEIPKQCWHVELPSF
jgi:hypothetical protein